MAFNQDGIIAGFFKSFAVSFSFYFVSTLGFFASSKNRVKMPIKCVVILEKPLTLMTGKAKMNSGRTHYCTYMYLFKENL